MSEHKWGPEDAERVRTCGCGFRLFTVNGAWQRKKGGHWRRGEVPHCRGVVDAPAKSSALEQLRAMLEPFHVITKGETAKAVALLAALESEVRADERAKDVDAIERGLCVSGTTCTHEPCMALRSAVRRIRSRT